MRSAADKDAIKRLQRAYDRAQKANSMLRYKLGVSQGRMKDLEDSVRRMFIKAESDLVEMTAQCQALSARLADSEELAAHAITSRVYMKANEAPKEGT